MLNVIYRAIEFVQLALVASMIGIGAGAVTGLLCKLAWEVTK